MAQTRWKVYRGTEHLASCKYIEDAARLAITGDRILDGDGVGRPCVWHEGHEEFSASESPDMVARVVIERCQDRVAAYLAKCRPVRLGDTVQPSATEAQGE